jgi:hypothetical protein
MNFCPRLAYCAVDVVEDVVLVVRVDVSVLVEFFSRAALLVVLLGPVVRVVDCTVDEDVDVVEGASTRDAAAIPTAIIATITIATTTLLIFIGRTQPFVD